MTQETYFGCNIIITGTDGDYTITVRSPQDNVIDTTEFNCSLPHAIDIGKMAVEKYLIEQVFISRINVLVEIKDGCVNNIFCDNTRTAVTVLDQDIFADMKADELDEPLPVYQSKPAFSYEQMENYIEAQVAAWKIYKEEK